MQDEAGLAEGFQRRELVYLATLIAIAAFLRLLGVGLRHNYLGFDESMFIVLGRNMLSGKGYTLNGLPNATFPFGMPLAAGVFCKLTGNARWSVNLATLVFGSLTILPVYLIARELWGRLSAVTASLLFAGFPALLFLVPYCHYAERLYAGSEAVFGFFLLSAAYTAVVLMRRPTVAVGLAFGFFAGLAFQVRQEALAYFLVLAAFVVLTGCLSWRKKGTKVLASAGAALVVCAVIAAPYVLWVKSVTGQYGLGPRFFTTFRMRVPLEIVAQSGKWGPALKEYFRPAGDDSTLETPYYGVDEYHLARYPSGEYHMPFSVILGELELRNISRAWKRVWQLLMPPGAWILVLVGLAWTLFERNWRTLALVAALAAPTALMAMLLYVLARFYLVFALALLFLGARGVDLCAQGAATLAAPFARTPRRAAAVYLVIPLALSLWLAQGTLVKARALGRNYDRFERRLEMQLDEFAPVLASVAPEGSRLVTFSPILEVRTGLVWLAMPEAEPTRIASYAKKRAADFILVRNTDGFWMKYKPDDFLPLFGEDRVVIDRMFSGDRYVVFDLRDTSVR